MSLSPLDEPELLFLEVDEEGSDVSCVTNDVCVTTTVLPFCTELYTRVVGDSDTLLLVIMSSCEVDVGSSEDSVDSVDSVGSEVLSTLLVTEGSSVELSKVLSSELRVGLRLWVRPVMSSDEESSNEELVTDEDTTLELELIAGKLVDEGVAVRNSSVDVSASVDGVEVVSCAEKKADVERADVVRPESESSRFVSVALRTNTCWRKMSLLGVSGLVYCGFSVMYESFTVFTAVCTFSKEHPEKYSNVANTVTSETRTNERKAIFMLRVCVLGVYMWSSVDQIKISEWVRWV